MPDVRNQIAVIIQDGAHNQSEIARRANMTPDKLCSVLKLRRRLDANEFLRLCDALGMTPDDVTKYKS